MPLDLKAWLLRSDSFCCCIPVRAGFLLLSMLTSLLSGAISVIIWFEISHSYQLSGKERTTFIVTAVVETLLFLASTIGFIGVVARKQLFVQIYTYFLYIHFILNLAVGIYFLVSVRASNRQQLVDYCADVFVNTSVESSCAKLMGVSTYVFTAIVAALLLLELYGVLIATRYVYRLRMQKRDDRSRRLGYFHALSQPETLSKHTRQASDNIELLREQEDSDPWDLGDPVLGLGTQTYMPVLMHDWDAPPALVPTSPPSSPPNSLSDGTSLRRIRALPPRPVGAVPSGASHAQEDVANPADLLPNPYESTPRSNELRSPDSEDEQHSVHSTEVSTSAHLALMDYGTYMGSVFASARPTPKFSR